MDGNAQKETCRAPAPGPDGFVPARPRVVLALAVLVLAGMAGFCLALYHSLTAVRPVDPADYPGAAPEGFRWEAAVSREDGRAVFTGWACVEGEPFPDVDIRVVLYHAEDGAYYSIPTQMTPDEAATAAVADGRGYALGGFTAVVPEKVLAHPLAEYEICIAYRVGGFDFLASTGKTAEVTGLTCFGGRWAALCAAESFRMRRCMRYCWHCTCNLRWAPVTILCMPPCWTNTRWRIFRCGITIPGQPGR